MRRVTYQQTTTARESRDDLANPHGNLAVRLQAAFSIGLALFLLLFTVTLALVPAATDGNIQAILIAAGICLAISLIAASALVIRWAFTVAERDWRVDDLERRRRWSQEDEDRLQARSLAEQLHAGEDEDTQGGDGGRLHVLAFALLQRHAAGESTARDECVRARLCTQAEWNAANKAFKLLGWKDGYSLTAPADLNRSWPEWEQRTYVDSRGVLWVKPSKGAHRPI